MKVSFQDTIWEREIEKLCAIRPNESFFSDKLSKLVLRQNNHFGDYTLPTKPGRLKAATARLRKNDISKLTQKNILCVVTTWKWLE